MLPNAYSKLKDKIAYCLEHFKGTRDDDKMLACYVWIKFYPNLIDGQEIKSVTLRNVLMLPSQDSIKRIRAKIQNEEHKFLPTSWAVAKRRQINEETWRASLGYDHC